MTYILIIYILIGLLLYIFQRELIYFPTKKISHRFEKIKLEKEILKNQILEKESEELREKIEESNKANKPSLIFLGFFGTIFTFVVLSVTSLIASIINRFFYRFAKA